MKIYFSGIGGSGIAPLAKIALDCGYEVVGSDLSVTKYLEELQQSSIQYSLVQDGSFLKGQHENSAIDWFVHTSAVKPGNKEYDTAIELGIKVSKRDELLNFILKDKRLKLLAVAGTHGKTTTTAMIVWVMKQLNIAVSYSIGSNISFAASSAYEKESQWFIYECDEFDRNFLSFHPDISLITSLDYDHPDTYETEEDYNNAFKQFSDQSLTTFCWQDVYSLVDDNQSVRLGTGSLVELIKLPGLQNRQNAALALDSLLLALEENYHPEELIKLVSQFPGTQRRFEKLTSFVYSDYAHHPAEIQATIQLAKELFDNLVVVYQPHQNVRQHLVKEEYKSCFTGADKVYWLPTYLSREDPKLELLSSKTLSDYVITSRVELSELNSELTDKLSQELKNGKTILFMGAGSVDDWARDFVKNNKLS